jgi:transposase
MGVITDGPAPSSPQRTTSSNETATMLLPAEKDPAPAAVACALPGDVEACHAMIAQLLQQQHEKDRTIQSLEHQLQQLLRRLYGRSAERIDPNQQVLFAELLQQLQAQQPQLTSEPAATTPKPSNNGHGRRRLPADLPRERKVIDLPESERPCPCCGKMREKIGEEISEKLGYVPAKVKVIQTVRPKYACRECDAAGNGAQIAIAELPASPIEKGLADASLLAAVIVGKYSDHVPLNRLEKIFARHDIDISRSTMCDWMAACAQALKPLHELMVQQVLGSRIIHTDDTPVDVLDKKLRQTRTGRFWIYSGDQDHSSDVFDFTPSRSRDGPMNFLQGWGKDEIRYLQADAFGGYDGVYRGEAGGKVIEVACMAHCRRKFHEARSSDPARSAQALAYVRLLYDVEDQATQQFQAQEKNADARSLASIRLELRQQLSLPRLVQFKAWMEAQQASHGGPVLPKSPLGAAITYALNQWEALCVYCTDGELSIDNNASERALRRIAVGRGNWMFCGSDNGGATAAILFSFIATCERHNVNPFDYLRDVLERIASTPISKLPDLLPNRWHPAQAAASVEVRC